MRRYKASLSCFGKTTIRVVVEASNVDVARRILEAQYPGYRITSVSPV